MDSLDFLHANLAAVAVYTPIVAGLVLLAGRRLPAGFASGFAFAGFVLPLLLGVWLVAPWPGQKIAYQQLTSSGSPIQVGEYFILAKGNKKGVVDAAGNTIIPYAYDEITIYTQSAGDYRFRCISSSNEGIFDRSGKTIVPLSKQQLSMVNRDPYHYLTLDEYRGSPYVVFHPYTTPATFGVFDDNGKLILPAEYENIHAHFENNLFCVAKQGKFGFVDPSNRVVVPFQYDSAMPFTDGCASVKINGKFGAINSQNQIIIPFDDYGQHFDFREGLSIFSKSGGKQGIIDTLGRIVLPTVFDRIEYVRAHQYYRCIRNGQVGIVDQHGTEVLQPIYSKTKAIDRFTLEKTLGPHTVYLVELNGKKGIVGSKGEVHLDLVFDNLIKEDGLYIYQTQGRYGIMDDQFRVILEPQFVKVMVHSSAWISVVDQHGQQYIVDHTGRKI
jgi:hypothetical protein